MRWTAHLVFRMANYASNSEGVCYSDPPISHCVFPSGQKESNPWGLYDMIGNVSEWTQDLYEAEPWKKIVVEGPHTEEYRVVRGCSFLDGYGACRSAMRFPYPPDRKIMYIGFRLVRDVSQNDEK